MHFFRYYTDEKNIEKVNISELRVRIEIYWMVKHYFKTSNYKINPYNVEEDEFMFLSEIQPEWLDIRDEDFLFKIVDSAPLGLTKLKKKKWCELKIIELFNYDTTPPEWLQSPDWPIVNGKPLVFKEMIEKHEHDLIVNEYIFYDKTTNEETIITQSDYR